MPRIFSDLQGGASKVTASVRTKEACGTTRHLQIHEDETLNYAPICKENERQQWVTDANPMADCMVLDPEHLKPPETFRTFYGKTNPLNLRMGIECLTSVPGLTDPELASPRSAKISLDQTRASRIGM